MARTLSDTLKEQQKWGLFSRPVIQARIVKKWGDVIRYDWVSVYSGEEDDYLQSSTMPTDGSLIRLRVKNPGSTKDLYYQRVTNPTDESDFTNWTDLSIANVLGVASCSYGAQVNQFYINTSREIYHRESDDSGANWGAWTLLDTAPEGTPKALAAAKKSNNDICLLFFIDTTLYRMKRVSGSWEDPTASPFTLTGASGVSVAYDLNWLIVATSEGEIEGKGVYCSQLGDGNDLFLNSWTPWVAIISRGSTEPYDYAAPSIMVD